MKLVAALALTLLPMMASAGVKDQIKNIDVSLDACLANPENQSTYGMNSCQSDAYEAADAILNREYQKATTNLKKAGDADSKEILRRLVASQRAWIAFRDANASLAGTSMLGGSGESTITLGALSRMTKDRVLELNEMVGSND